MKHSVITPKTRQRPGNVLIMTIVFIVALSFIVTTIQSRTSSSIPNITRRTNDPVITAIAETGIEKAVYCLNTPSAPAADCPKNAQGLYVGESNVVFGAGTYTSTVNTFGLTATVDVVASITQLGQTRSKEIQVILSQQASINPSLLFGVQSGEGGIVMGNNASVIGNVYTNGSITGGNGSSVTGDAVLAVSSPTTDATSNPSVSPLLTKNIGDASNTVYLAQKFVSSVNDSIYSLDVRLAKHGAANTATAYIYSDDNGAPGNDLSNGGQVLNAAFPSDSPGGWENGWTNQIFASNPILLENTSYWLVLKISTANSSKYWTTVRSADDTTYAQGEAKIGSSLTTLSSLGYDISFQINVGGQYPTLDVPTVGGSAYSHNITDTTVGTHAYYQVLNGTVKANGGAVTCTLTPNSYCHPAAVDQAPQNFPISDAQIAQIESVAVAGGTTTCSPTCIIHDGEAIGPRKYIGDVVFDGGSVVTLQGSVWIQGNITLDNNVILQLDPGYGTNNGMFVADTPADRTSAGKITFSNNGDLRGTGNASCTGTPKRCSDGINKNNTCSLASDCPINAIMAISMNSDPALTAKAIDVSNNLTAGILYAPKGLVSISNNASLKEVTAQKLALSENASIKYMTGLASAIFSSGPGASWQLKAGSYHIIK
jgi:hypothetical protein